MSDAQATPRPAESVVEERETTAELETEQEPAESASADESTSAGTGIGTLPLDQVFDVLRNERRRRALRFLVENGGRVEMSELAENLAAWETDKPVSELTSSERKRVYVALYQCHLPRMDDMDVVEFNKPRGVIELGPNAEALNHYLEDAEELEAVEPWRGDDDTETDQQWPRYYAAIVLGGAALYLVSLSVGGVAAWAVLGVVLLAMGVTCALHFRAASHALANRPWASEG